MLNIKKKKENKQKNKQKQYGVLEFDLEQCVYNSRNRAAKFHTFGDGLVVLMPAYKTIQRSICLH